ncbi:hypothetical protein C8256_06260 [Kluyvera genomosp. 2]|uniref:Uncharacterized protein n=1 Tax=Kluyvera genomosp. 2 TaxID=2774054 RepID=A0A2T2Y5V1_9ENTR|nr:hypothetical protein C8256_06260 [Kluyvera genomosp. 2]
MLRGNIEEGVKNQVEMPKWRMIIVSKKKARERRKRLTQAALTAIRSRRDIAPAHDGVWPIA